VACDFRNAVAHFLQHHDPGPAPEDPQERFEWQRDWAALLVDKGFAAPGWPRQYGGMGLSVGWRAVYYEEFAKTRRPPHPGPEIFVVGMAIIRHGTEAQRRRFLRPGLRGDVIWVQGFAEPSVGSDLPDVQTAAIRRGDEYVVTGKKLFGYAQRADWMYTLVRTSDDTSGRNGLTYLLIDLASPGVNVRQLGDSTTVDSHFEVALDAVRVPVDNRVGVENGGWHVACTSMFRSDVRTVPTSVAS
jgi:alkylation response protein AidB-like acyl-CoA dehydrogenase